MSYISLLEFKIKIGLGTWADPPDADPLLDPIYQRELDAADDLIDGWCHRNFRTPVDVAAVLLPAPASSMLVIPDLFDASAITVFAYGVELSTARYRLHRLTPIEPCFGLIERFDSAGNPVAWDFGQSAGSSPYDKVQIADGVWGYSDEVPPLVQQIALRLALRSWGQYLTDYQNSAGSTNIMGETRSPATVLTEDMKKMLREVRREVIPQVVGPS